MTVTRGSRLVKEGCGGVAGETNQEWCRDEEGLYCSGGIDDHPPETTKADGLTKGISPGRGAVQPKDWRRLFSYSNQ